MDLCVFFHHTLRSVSQYCTVSYKIARAISVKLTLTFLSGTLIGTVEKILLLVSFPLSLILIFKGSDWLTDSLEPVARKLKTSNIAVGLLLISVVVSLPEILIASEAALRGHQQISMGIVFGSIIVNIGMMTGLSAMIRPLQVNTRMIARDGVISLIIPLIILAISHEGTISRLDGLILFLLFIPYIINIVLQEKQASVEAVRKDKQEVQKELALIDFGFGKFQPGILGFVLGVALLLYGSYFFTDQLILLTHIFELGELFIGLTLGAIVPSIPNIVTAVKATKKGMTDVAVSETIGSNVFTLLVTVGITSMLSPIQVETQWLHFDLPVLILMSFLLVAMMMTGRTITRKEGAVLMGAYLIILTTQIVWFNRM